VARPPAPVHVRGDDTRLVQSVANLLTNAAKYTPPGGRIWVALDMHHGLATLSVRDSGVGIDPGFLPHVFELFSQGARTPDRSIGGLGIGLALVRRIVELHGGRIEATSAGVGRGSMFSIALPTVPAPAGPTGAAPSTGSGAGAGPSPPPAPKRIVIVDDNVDASEALAALLELDGHAVTVHHADAWLLDIGLPGMDGYELARRLRGRRPHALLIALTGYGQPDDRERSREAGFDHHFLKPVEPEALARVLNGATPRPPARDDGRSG